MQSPITLDVLVPGHQSSAVAEATRVRATAELSGRWSDCIGAGLDAWRASSAFFASDKMVVALEESRKL